MKKIKRQLCIVLAVTLLCGATFFLTACKKKKSSDDSESSTATIYYYSETQPTTEGNYWRYVDGIPTAW